MPYYNRPMGDYGTGGYGYPQGDPGLFSFIGKLIPKVIGFFKKPVVQAVIGGAVGGAAAEQAQQAMGPPYGAQPGQPPVPYGTGMPGVGTRAVIRRPGMVPAGFAAAGACPSGYHPAKDGSARCVRNRRMNIANPRALRRSMRRVKGFEKLARKTISFTKRVRIKS